jgi:hypothetical protein
MSKTKAQLELELADAAGQIELRDVEIASLRRDIEELIGVDTDDPPARSEVLPGGGVAQGAILRIATSPHLPTTARAPESIVWELAKAAPGDEWAFGEPYSFLLADGGYARAERLTVISQAPGVTTVEVLR